MFRRGHSLLVLNKPSLLFSLNQSQATLGDALLFRDWRDLSLALHERYGCVYQQEQPSSSSLPSSEAGTTADTMTKNVVKPVFCYQSRPVTCCLVTTTVTPSDDDEKEISTSRPSLRSVWIPFIVDTGAPLAVYLSRKAFKKLGVKVDEERSNPSLTGGRSSSTGSFRENLFSKRITIGNWQGLAALSEEQGESITHLEDINIIGIGLLGETSVLSQDLTKILSKVLLDDDNNNVAVPRQAVWVQLWSKVKTSRNNEENKLSNMKSVGDPFPVTPEMNDVARLKKAIKAELGSVYTANWNPGLVSIFDPEDRNQVITKMSSPLKASTEESPYCFVLPS